MTDLPRHALTDEEAERLRKRDSLPTLPPIYQEIAALIGQPLTLRLARRLGGSTVEFPARTRPGSELHVAVGRKAVALLHARFGTERVALPSAWPYLNLVDAREMRTKGRTIREICQALRIGRTTAIHYTRGIAAPPTSPARAGRPTASLPPAPLLDLMGGAAPER